uniref:Uncharacterized protein n=1 Tax=Oryza meridionalis TaxID=40149 RepID=A0A0E0C5B8_9ORYZ
MVPSLNFNISYCWNLEDSFTQLIDQNASVIEVGEGGKKAAPAPATKRNVQRPAANGEEAEAERSDSDESVDP